MSRLVVMMSNTDRTVYSSWRWYVVEMGNATRRGVAATKRELRMLTVICSMASFVSVVEVGLGGGIRWPPCLSPPIPPPNLGGLLSRLQGEEAGMEVGGHKGGHEGSRRQIKQQSPMNSG